MYRLQLIIQQLIVIQQTPHWDAACAAITALLAGILSEIQKPKVIQLHSDHEEEEPPRAYQSASSS